MDVASTDARCALTLVWFPAGSLFMWIAVHVSPVLTGLVLLVYGQVCNCVNCFRCSTVNRWVQSLALSSGDSPESLIKYELTELVRNTFCQAICWWARIRCVGYQRGIIKWAQHTPVDTVNSKLDITDPYISLPKRDIQGKDVLMYPEQFFWHIVHFD